MKRVHANRRAAQRALRKAGFVYSHKTRRWSQGGLVNPQVRKINMYRDVALIVDA